MFVSGNPVKKRRFVEQHRLSPGDAEQLTAERTTADYFEAVLSQTRGDAKSVANWINSELTGYLNDENKDIDTSPISDAMLAQLINRIHDNTISGKIAKDVFRSMWAGEITFMASTPPVITKTWQCNS